MEQKTVSGKIPAELHARFRRPHFSPNGPTGSAEGNPTAAGQCLAGGRCRENKS